MVRLGVCVCVFLFLVRCSCNVKTKCSGKPFKGFTDDDNYYYYIFLSFFCIVNNILEVIYEYLKSRRISALDYGGRHYELNGRAVKRQGVLNVYCA